MNLANGVTLDERPNAIRLAGTSLQKALMRGDLGSNLDIQSADDPLYIVAIIPRMRTRNMTRGKLTQKPNRKSIPGVDRDNWEDYDEDEWYTNNRIQNLPLRGPARQPGEHVLYNKYPNYSSSDNGDNYDKSVPLKTVQRGAKDLYHPLGHIAAHTSARQPRTHTVSESYRPGAVVSDDEGYHGRHGSFVQVQPGERPLHPRDPSGRHKISNRLHSENSTFSANGEYSTRKSNQDNALYQLGEAEDIHHHLEDRDKSWPKPITLPRGPGEHMLYHKEAPPIPRISRRAPTWTDHELYPNKPTSAPRSINSSTDDDDIVQRPDYDVLLPTQDPHIVAMNPHTDNGLAYSIGRRHSQLARPTTSRSLSENLTSRPSAVFPNDSRFEAERPRIRKQFRNLNASTDVSAHVLHPTASAPQASGMLGMKNYLYRRLEQKLDFRLVRVLPQRTSKLKCEILHASLERPPEYVAISYTWGDGVDMKGLILGGATISVSASLHGALKAVRDKDHEVLVWIDGLSIDQQNKEERASQVRLMGYIYSRAQYVAVWLGPDADDSQSAISLLEEVDRRRIPKHRIRAVQNPDSAALRSLFKRDYWSRLWVVQEVFLARKKWVFCGSSKLPWEAYENASDAFWEHESDPHLRQGPSSFPNVASLVDLGADSLLEVLRACRKKLSENPRDKVFGVLGMLPEETRKEIPVNYDQSLKSLYIDVADHIISSTRRLDVIRESIHFPVHVDSTGLPSWCPDWSHIPDIAALRERNFSAAGDTDAEYEFHDNERKLEVSAIELGVINATGVAVGTLCALQDYLMAFLNWRALLLNITNISEDDENDQLLEAFCRTLALGQVPRQWEQHGWRTPCYHVFSSLIQKRLPRLSIDRGLQRYADMAVMRPEEHRMFVQKHFGDRMMGRTFCVTDNGLMGIGSGFMAKGDVVVVPFGCSTPILVRAEGRRNEYRYVGDVYVEGFMHGEALSGDRPVKKYMLH
ncbi:Nn.00g095290.m01.CDS01 [Neocucurbitaria sp. VM-36]